MKHILIALAVMLTMRAEGQLSSPFQLLDTTLLSSKYFANQAPGLISLKNRNGQLAEVTSPGQGKQILLELLESQFEGPAFASLTELRETSTEALVQEHAVPLIITDFSYHCLLPWAIDSAMVDTIGGLFSHQSPGTNPFCQEFLFSAFTFQTALPVEGARIVLLEEFYFSNRQEPVLMEINVMDGLGFVPFNWGDQFELAPNEDAYTIGIRFRRDGVQIKAIAQTKAMSCADAILPDLPPWESEDSFYPWKISTTWNGQLVEANAYVRFGDDSHNGLFTKPFIFVEGIDFNVTDVYPQSHGDFGWCQFSTGTDPEYAFLYNAPIMIDELLTSGYDVILLDFKDGADFVQKNAEVLKHLIHLVNDYKEGDEPNVISGASMGGQITRYALRKMELENDPHCSRLWISLDSPHTGAHIPISLQYLIYFLANPQNPSSGQAVHMLNTTLYRPAARQFLIQQLPSLANLSGEYYSMMNGMGFPEKLRSVSIANGSGTGLTQNLTTNPLLNYNIHFQGDPQAWLRVYPAPGNNVPWQGPQHLLFSGKLPTGTFNLPSWLGGACVPTGFYQDEFQTPGPIYRDLEFCPGGSRPTMLQIVNEMNAVLSSGDCSSDPITDYQVRHSFIPTLSALGLPMDEPFIPAAELMDSDPGLLPFDAAVYAPGDNETHSEITNQSLTFVLTEVSLGENQLPPVLDSNSPNNGVFNAGRPQFTYLRTVDINSGGKLYLNAQQPNYFAQIPSEFPEQGSHLDFYSSGCGSEIRVNSGGEIHIGSPSGESTASLTIVKGSLLELNSSGMIVVHPGSKLVIDREAIFRQFRGLVEIKDGAEVEILEDADIRLSDECVWRLDHGGGRFGLNSNVSFAPQAELKIISGSQGGTLTLNREVSFLGEGSNRLRMSGQGSDTPLLQANQGGSLVVDIGFELVRMKGFKAEFHSGMGLSIQAKTILEQVEFLCPNFEGAEAEVFNKATIIDSRVEQMQLRIDQSDVDPQLVFVSNTKFDGRKAMLRILSGRMSVQNCSFTQHAQLRSSQLNEDSFIRYSEFEGDGPSVPFANYDDGREAIADDSDIKLIVADCLIKNYRGAGILKVYGDLMISCSEFYSNHSGLIATNEARIFMDELSGNGGNQFRNNRFNIHLGGADELNLKNGRNQFSPGLELNFRGDFNRDCSCSTHAFLDARGNSWSLFVPEEMPNPLQFDLWYHADCDDAPWQDACPIPVVANNPAELDCKKGPDWNLTLAKVNNPDLNDLWIFPNPVSEHLNISSSKSGTIRLCNLLGEEIMGPYPLVEEGMLTLDLSNLSEGIYLIILDSDGEKIIEKVIVGGRL